MGKINTLTAIGIKNAPPGKLFDGGGLQLVKTATGGKWIYRYSFQGRRREMGLGPYPKLSLAAARKLRDEWTEVLLNDMDPINEREERRRKAAQQSEGFDPTFAEACDLTFEAIRAGLRGDGTRGRWRSPLDIHVIPKIGRRKVSQLTQTDLHDAIKPIWKTKHETASKAIERIKKVLTHSRLSGADVDPFIVEAAKHMLGIHDHKVQPITATPWQAVPALFQRLDKDIPSYMALQWTILTVTRGDSARGARFSEIDGDVWTVPANRMKGAKNKVSDFRVPLSSQALEVVERARHYSTGDFLFPSPRSGCVSVQALTKVLNHLEEPGRPHGFRTSFRTWVQETDACSFDVAEMALGHVLGNQVERAYARSDLLERRRIAMQAWGNFVTAADSNIISLSG